MILKVLMYNKEGDYHICEAEDGSHINVDLLVNADLAEPKSLTKETWEEYLLSMVGKKFYVDELSSYISIAYGVKELKKLGE